MKRLFTKIISAILTVTMMFSVMSISADTNNENSLTSINSPNLLLAQIVII